MQFRVGRTRTAAVALGLFALLVAACGGSSDKAAPAPTTVADGHDHAHDAAGAPAHAGMKVLAGTATGTSPCEIAQPAPSSPGQTGSGEGGSGGGGGHSEERGMLEQAELTQAERVELQDQMVQARTVIDKYPTVADAEAAGYNKSTPYVPCIGAHYTNISLVAKFDPAAPSELLYDGTTPDAKIVGLSYLVFHPGGAPEGFAGPNDHWHQHNANGGLCLIGGSVVGGEGISEEDCAARGGKKRVLTDIWMVHAWVAPGYECTWGVFAGECPELGGVICGTAFDAPVADDPRGKCGAAPQ